MGKRGLSLFFALLCGCAHEAATGLAFGVLGDTPYTDSEVHRLDGLIDDMNRERLDFVVHVGDIGAGTRACTDAWLEARKAQFARLRERLARLGNRMPERVVLVHGDSHFYHDDEPIPGVRRLEVWGSPIVSWVRGGVEAGELAFSAPRYR